MTLVAVLRHLGESYQQEHRKDNDTDNDIQLMFVVIGGNTDLKFTSPCQVKAREEGVMPVEYQYSGSFPTETRVYPVINGRALMKPLKITCTNPVD